MVVMYLRCYSRCGLPPLRFGLVPDKGPVNLCGVARPDARGLGRSGAGGMGGAPHVVIRRSEILAGARSGGRPNAGVGPGRRPDLGGRPATVVPQMQAAPPKMRSRAYVSVFRHGLTSSPMCLDGVWSGTAAPICVSVQHTFRPVKYSNDLSTATCGITNNE